MVLKIQRNYWENMGVCQLMISSYIRKCKHRVKLTILEPFSLLIRAFFLNFFYDRAANLKYLSMGTWGTFPAPAPWTPDLAPYCYMFKIPLLSRRSCSIRGLEANLPNSPITHTYVRIEVSRPCIKRIAHKK